MPIANVSDQLSTAASVSEVKIKKEQEVNDQDAEIKVKNKKSKRKHSEISHSIKGEHKTNTIEGNSESPLPVKKRKKSRIE